MEMEVAEGTGRSLFAGEFRPAPLALVAVAFAAVVAGIVMVFVGATHSGVTTDEPLHVKRIQSFFNDGLYVLNSERQAAGKGVVPDSAYVYGPATALVMHDFNVRAGNELEADPRAKVQKPQVVSWLFRSFIVRHLAVASISMLAVLAMFGLGWMLLGSWRWGVVCAGVLAAVPAWTGSAMFNMKDSPVGTGYTVMTFALVGIVMSGRLAGPARWAGLALSALAMIPGIAFMMGTRPGMWPAVLSAVTAMLVILAVGRALHWQIAFALVAGLTLSYLELRHIYPRVFDDLFHTLKISATASAEYPHSLPPGRGYVFGHTLVEWPVFLLLFMLLGTVVALVLCWRWKTIDPHRSAALAIVGAQAFALPMAAVVTNANLYHGLRQLLFAFPGQAVLATIGIAAACSAAPYLRGRRLIAGLAMAGLILPLLVQARMFPYQYSYENVAAEVVGVDVSNDYFRSSFGELVNDVPASMKTRCLHWHSSYLRYKPGQDCRNHWGSLKAQWLDHWGHARVDPDSSTFYAVMRYEAGVPKNCHVIKEVTRKRNLKTAVMSRLARCTMTPPVGMGRQP